MARSWISRVRWQEEMDVDQLAMSLDEGTHLVVISSRTVPPPALPDRSILNMGVFTSDGCGSLMIQERSGKRWWAQVLDFGSV